MNKFLLDSKDALLTIDYLIVNLQGLPFIDLPDLYINSDGQLVKNELFSLDKAEFGTKIFCNKYDVFYCGGKIGTLQTEPRSKEIMKEDFNQFQFENEVFYSFTLLEIKEILENLCEWLGYTFKAVNRLDIAVDIKDSSGVYKKIHSGIYSGKYQLSGRTKNITTHHETSKAGIKLNGYTVGKRSSKQFLRIYNKTENLKVVEKPYINAFLDSNNVENIDIWRFEMQLNSDYFRDKERVKKYDDYINTKTGKKHFKWVTIGEPLTYSIFEYDVLLELLYDSTKGYFQIRENTGKCEINKEREIKLFHWAELRKKYKSGVSSIQKIKKHLNSSSTTKKRLIKGLFREYYCSKQNEVFIIPLNQMLEETDLTEFCVSGGLHTKEKENDFEYKYKTLGEWFGKKVFHYLKEFKRKEKSKYKWDRKKFEEDLKTMI